MFWANLVILMVYSCLCTQEALLAVPSDIWDQIQVSYVQGNHPTRGIIGLAFSPEV